MEFGGYDLPIGVTAYRFLYHSRSAAGEDVASSGVILVPYKKAPAGGWPAIAWAHEANGVARQCAPSLQRNLQHGPLLSMYVNLGYAVVATDYSGLGTKFRNAGADSLSNAWDVIYAIPAARSAMHELGSKWVAIGTGEGGRAAVTVAELEHGLHDPNYLGSIAVPRLADLQDRYETTSTFSTTSALQLAYGVKSIFPKFEVKEILTDPGLSLYEKMGQTCDENSQKIEPETFLTPNWRNNPLVRQYFSRNRLGLTPAAGPLFVASSADDLSIKVTNRIVAQLCKQGDRVQFQKYPEYDPGRVIGDSVTDQMNWIQARFVGRVTPSDCPTK